MSEVRIYMPKKVDMFGEDHPIIYDNSGRGWFYYEDIMETDWSKRSSWTYLSKDCIHHKESDMIADPDWELAGEL